MDLSPKCILIVYDYREAPDKMRLTIKHHLQALETSEIKHELVYFNTFDDVPTWVLDGRPAVPPAWLANKQFDAVVLHYSFLSFRTTGSFFFKWKQHFDWIGKLDCLKIAIPQDEFDRAGLLDEWLFDWDVSVVFTVQHRGGQGPLYPIMRDKAAFYECLPGYIDEATAACYAQKMLPLAERPYDIVYRARKLPYRYGSIAQLKHQIAEVVQARAQAFKLKCNISTRAEDAVLGNRWLDFISSGRAVIGCEGGTSVIDWHGENEAMIKQILRDHPTFSFEEIKAQMPQGWDDYRFVTITPRHFEAVIAKTCQILIEGEYRGILEANKHYIPLKPDFSNLDEALATLNDHRLVQDMVEQAYQDIYLSGKYTYRTLAKEIEKALLTSLSQRRGGPEEVMIEPHKTLLTLERQLVAERHKAALLEVELLEAKESLGQLQGKLSTLTTDNAILQAILNPIQAEISAIYAEFQTIRAERAALETERMLMNAERKKWFILMAGTILAALIISAIVSAAIIFLVLLGPGAG